MNESLDSEKFIGFPSVHSFESPEKKVKKVYSNLDLLLYYLHNCSKTTFEYENYDDNSNMKRMRPYL